MTWETVLLMAVAAIALLAALAILGVRMYESLRQIQASQPRRVGQHREDTVEIVPPDYWPKIGRRRFGELTTTQRIDTADLEDGPE